MRASKPTLQLVIKVAAHCNLNCSYCYVYHKSDQTWQHQPRLMSDEVFEAALRRLRNHCSESGQEWVQITFHGGEPCLLGHRRFAAWCERIRVILADVTQPRLCIQTNGTLIDENWARVLKVHQVEVGLSLDGPPALHDANRVDHAGKGSYVAAARGFKRLAADGTTPQILSVIPLGEDGLQVHRHFLDLGVRRINYLFPDYNHDTIAEVHQRYGPTPCADFLIPIFDDWWFNGTLDVRVSLFWNIARIISGGESLVDFLGNPPLRFVFVQPDGAIEGLDVLRTCAEGLSATGLNVFQHDFSDIADLSDVHRAVIFEGTPLPKGCQMCPERDTCAGGYLPHRYSQALGFDNPSAWCADLWKLFQHIRSRMNITPSDTQIRRIALDEMMAEAAIC
jgi:uncharacterized protein